MDYTVTGRFTPEERARIKRLCKQVAAVLQQDNTDPQIAIVVILNVSASIIASRFPGEEGTNQVSMMTRMLPLYVASYTQRDIPIIGG